jgi:predicted tellurium resistance membrane protein TerC
MDAVTSFFGDFEVFKTGAAWVSLLTLTALELVLGIDNIVFISILTGKLPPEQQPRIRRIGLLIALVMRIALLFAITWVMGLTKVLFTMPVVDRPITGKDLILLLGGLFLLFKATHEIFAKLEGDAPDETARNSRSQVGMVLVQIVLIDLVFSVDSIITAVGMSQSLPVMIVAMVLAVGAMMLFAEPVSNFVNRHPSMKILALSFLMLIGVLLVADAFGQHVSRGMLYFAMGFSLAVELLNMRMRKKQKVVKIHGPEEITGPLED